MNFWHFEPRQDGLGILGRHHMQPDTREIFCSQFIHGRTNPSKFPNPNDPILTTVNETLQIDR